MAEPSGVHSAPSGSSRQAATLQLEVLEPRRQRGPAEHDSASSRRPDRVIRAGTSGHSCRHLQRVPAVRGDLGGAVGRDQQASPAEPVKPVS